MSPVRTPLRLPVVAEDHFVHGRRVVRQIVVRLQRLADVVRVQHRVDAWRCAGRRRRAPGCTPARAPARRSCRRTPAPGRSIAAGCSRTSSFLPERLQARRRQERLEHLLHGHRTRARTAAAVRRGEGLVQVQVHHVDAEIAGPRDADQRVHVGAVHVDQRALRVQDLGDLA